MNSTSIRTLALALALPAMLAAPGYAGPFADLCEDKDTPADVRKTIDVMLASIPKAEDRACAKAEGLLKRRTYFEFPNKGITSIKPLTLFPKIRSLLLKNNAITSLEGVSALSKLTRIDVRGNSVKDLTPVNGLQKLRMLYVQNNAITSLKGLDDVPKLRILNMNDNPITDLSDLPAFPSLVGLHMAKAKPEGPSLGDLTPLARISSLRGLTLKNNPGIRNIASLTQVETLNVAGTKLKDLSEVGQLQQLERLEISENPLATAESIAELGNLTKLTTLNMFKTGIKDIDVLDHLDALDYLDISGNKIESLMALKNLGNLTRLFMHDNPLGTTIKRTEANCPKDASAEIVRYWCNWEDDGL